MSEEEGAVRNVFVSSVQQGREGVMVSRTGRLETAENGDRFVVLENGRRYEGLPGTANFRVTEFARYALRIQDKPRKTPELTSRSASTLELLAVNLSTFRGELLWRIGVPVAALVLARITSYNVCYTKLLRGRLDPGTARPGPADRPRPPPPAVGPRPPGREAREGPPHSSP